MSLLNKASLEAKFNDAATGLFRAGQGDGEIESDDERALVKDLVDSVLFKSDHLLDEDDMASNSATHVPSQQSVKAYVDRFTNAGTAAGTDTYTLAMTPTLLAYVNMGYIVLFTNANTGAATLNIDTLGAKAITKNGATALSAGDIEAGSVKLLVYDGTQFQIVGDGGGGGGLTKPITASYADVAALLADQGVLPQATGEWYYVTDASTDATVTSGWAIYEKLAATTGALTDYLKIMEQESIDVVINDASETVKGIIEIANQTEAEAAGNATSSGSADHARAMTGRGVWWFFEARRLLSLFYRWIWDFVDETGTSHTFVLADAGKSIRCSNAGTTTLTIPTNATVAYPVGTRFRFKRTGAGLVVIAPAGGVTIQASDVGNLTIRKQYGFIDAVKTATDTWELVHTPSSFWEWAKTQTASITAAWEIVGTDSSSATYSFVVKNLAGDVIMRTRNDQVVEFGGSAHMLEVGSAVTSNNALFRFNDNQVIAYKWIDRNNTTHLQIRTTTGDKANTWFQKQEYSFGEGFTKVHVQAKITTSTSNGAWNNIFTSAALADGEAIDLHVNHLSAWATDGSLISAYGAMNAAVKRAGSTTSAVVPTFTLAGVGLAEEWRIAADDSAETLTIDFKNSSTGKTWEVMIDFTYIKRTLPV